MKKNICLFLIILLYTISPTYAFASNGVVIKDSHITSAISAALSLILPGNINNPISNEDELYAAVLRESPGGTIYVTDMRITKQLIFDQDIDITIASATEKPVILSTTKPASGAYPFNFNGSNVNLTFKNIVIQGDDTHVLMRFQNTKDVLRVITGAVFKNGYREGNGGALFVENGNIKVVNCIFENNRAARGAALYLGNNIKTGGNGDAVIIGCTFINNTATDFEGGAVSIRNDYNPEKGNVAVIDSLFKNNNAIGAYSVGGALSAYGNISIDNCEFEDNSAASGGAISAGGKMCTISGSNISGNRAKMDNVAADLYNQYGIACGGGGIYSTTANIRLLNSTMDKNETTQNGGAICSAGAVTSITGGKIIANLSAKDGGGIYSGTDGFIAIDGFTQITGNKAGNYGGGIYTVDTTYTNLSSDYASLTTASNTKFSRNTSLVAYQPPDNAQILYPNIGFTGVSVANHPLNNYDINYKSTRLRTVRVTYESNGGRGRHVGPNIPPGKEDSVLSPEETDISLTGCDFIGWNTKSDNNGIPYAPGDDIILFSDVTLYAQWSTGRGESVNPRTGDTGNLLPWTSLVFILINIFCRPGYSKRIGKGTRD